MASVSSIDTNWVYSIKLCKINGLRPAKVDDMVYKKIWIGSAIYRHHLDEVYLQITEEDGQRTCTGTGTDGYCPNTDECEFCDIRMLGLKLSRDIFHNLTSNFKYIVADFRSIEEIPEPDLCLLNTENFTKEYVSCKKKYKEGCEYTENFSKWKIIIQKNHIHSIKSSSKHVLMKSRGTQLRLNFTLLMLLLAHIQALLPSI